MLLPTRPKPTITTWSRRGGSPPETATSTTPSRSKRAASSGRSAKACSIRAARAKKSGLSVIDSRAPPRIRFRPSSGRSFSDSPSDTRDEGELADLGEARGDRQGRAQRVPEGQHDGDRRQGLAHHDHAEHRQDRERRAHEDARIEQHADGDEEQDREGVLQRQRVGGRLVAEIGLGEHHPGEERPEREGDSEQLRRAEGDAQGQGQDRQGEQLPRAGARRLIEQPGHEAASADQHQRREDGDLGERQSDGQREALRAVGSDELGPRGP
jgi:hypothetical protein